MLEAFSMMLDTDPAVAATVTKAMITLTATTAAHFTPLREGWCTLQNMAVGKKTAVG